MMQLSGRKYGRLAVVAEAAKRGKTRRWVCRCECGRVADVPQQNLITGKTKSCGCLQRERAATRAKAMGKANARHGKSKSVEWAAWHHMRQRCRDVNHPQYPNYGGRGITICDRWDEFEPFLADVGPRPGKGHSLDRIDVNRGYEPGNVRWADHKTQQRNRQYHRLVTHQGRTLCVGEWAELAGLTVAQLWLRLFRSKWPMEKAMAEPLRRVRRKTTLITS